MDAITPIPLDRWDCDRLLIRDQDANTSGTSGRFGGFVAQWADFDAPAFGLKAPEAVLMDPQQRVLLEVGTWHTGPESYPCKQPLIQYTSMDVCANANSLFAIITMPVSTQRVIWRLFGC